MVLPTGRQSRSSASRPAWGSRETISRDASSAVSCRGAALALPPRPRGGAVEHRPQRLAHHHEVRLALHSAMMRLASADPAQASTRSAAVGCRAHNGMLLTEWELLEHLLRPTAFHKLQSMNQTFDLASTRPPSSVTPFSGAAPLGRPFSAAAAALAAATSGASTCDPLHTSRLQQSDCPSLCSDEHRHAA